MKSLLALFLLSSFAKGASLEAYRHNLEGVRKLKQNANYLAYQEFLQALGEDPLNPALQMNLGLSFEANEEWVKAAKAYQAALSLAGDNKEIKFQALFNLGNALGKDKKVAEALRAYQGALDLQPDSLETKTNIELLTQQNGGGGGGDQNQDKKEGGQDQKQQQGEGDQQKKPDQGQQVKQEEQKKKQPKPFESQELTPADVKKILDEIKNQEQAIRAQDYKKGAKESPRAKDW